MFQICAQDPVHRRLDLIDGIGIVVITGPIMFHDHVAPMIDDIDVAAAQIDAILTAERLRRRRRIGLTQFVRDLTKYL